MATDNLGTLTSTAVSRNNHTVNDADPTDVFAFNIVGTQSINLSLDSVTGNTNIKLYRDVNGDGQLDSGDQLLVNGKDNTFFGGGDEGINYRAFEGNYLAQVVRSGSPLGGGSNRTYNLDLSATQSATPFNLSSTPSNLLPKEVQVGELSGYDYETYTGTINNTNTADVYAFNLAVGAELDISLTGLSANANMRLIRDSDSDGIVDANEVVMSSTNGGSQSESISTDLGGDYLLQVYQNIGNTNYTLEFQCDIAIG